MGKKILKDRIISRMNNNKTFKYNNRLPVHIDDNLLTKKQRTRLLESETFCILPWIHLHSFPDGRAYPCCLSDYWHPVGDLRKNTMAEIWNQEPMREMRLNMLEDKPCKECTKCYEQEENGFFSMRNSFARDFGQHINLVDQTKPDGSVEDFKIRYYDIRFSNLCNFRCRTCGPVFSSNWYNDHIKLYDKKPDVLGRPMNRVEYAGKHKYDMWEQMEEHIPYLDQVYFAGGEPLIMEEHYMILNELVRRGLFHVRLIYNTNFSEMFFKDQDVMELWKLFDVVAVGASLDGSHARGEYIRKGQEWKQTVANRERMLKICPKVDFYISSTISIYNVGHVPDFHREWVDLGLIRPMDWNINILQGPNYERADILPQYYKEKITDKLNQHIEWLEPKDNLTRATHGYRGIVNFINQNNQESLLREFFANNDKLDLVRNEKFEDVFTEYKDLRSYVT
jgi:MoaA/NifB/PqqE/SkfB family radical SAM enzyme